MKHFMLTALLGTTMALFSQAAYAETLHNGLGTGISGQVGVSTPIANADIGADTQVRTTTRTRIDNHGVQDYRHHNDEDVKSRTQYQASTHVAPQDISPSAGAVHQDVPPSARVMGEIQGGMSYND